MTSVLKNELSSFRGILACGQNAVSMLRRSVARATLAAILGLTLLPLVALGGSGVAKVQASFKDIKNETADDANDFHIEINKDFPPDKLPEELGIKIKSNKLKGTTGLTVDPTKHTSTIKINGKLGEKVEVGDKDTIKIEFPSEKNELKINKAYWTKDTSPLPGGNVPEKKLPGFKVVGDPIYTFINSSLDEAIGVRNLQFLFNVPEVPLDDLEPGTIAGFGPSLPDFVVAPGGSIDFNIPGSLDPGNFLYAQGELFDAGFTELQGVFLHGHQEALPEPSGAPMLLTACLFALRRERRARESHKNRILHNN